MKTGDLIVLEWVDPSKHSGYHDKPEELVGALCIVPGWFINQDDRYIRVAHLNYGSGGMQDILVIPNSLLIKKPRKIPYGKE